MTAVEAATEAWTALFDLAAISPGEDLSSLEWACMETLKGLPYGTRADFLLALDEPVRFFALDLVRRLTAIPEA